MDFTKLIDPALSEHEAAWRRVRFARTVSILTGAIALLAFASWLPTSVHHGGGTIVALLALAVTSTVTFFIVLVRTTCPRCYTGFFVGAHDFALFTSTCQTCGARVNEPPPELLHERLMALAGDRAVRLLHPRALEWTSRGVRVVIEQSPGAASFTHVDADATHLSPDALDAFRVRVKARLPDARVSLVKNKARVAIPGTDHDPSAVGDVLDDLTEVCAGPQERAYR
jgi:hypothetical protein